MKALLYRPEKNWENFCSVRLDDMILVGHTESQSPRRIQEESQKKKKKNVV